MNYKQKYKDALERAETLYENTNCMILKKRVEQVFPELKEDSEDERIRVNAIHIIRDAMNGIVVGLPLSIYKECIAYLEKQGKIIDEYEDKLDRCACENFDKGYKVALETQGEQKPTLPTWCKEDEQMLQRANSAFEYACFDSKSMILWLKSLKERLKGE